MVLVNTRWGQDISLTDVLWKLNKCLNRYLIRDAPASDPIDTYLSLIRLDELIVRSSVIFSIPLLNMDQRQSKGKPNSGQPPKDTEAY